MLDFGSDMAGPWLHCNCDARYSEGAPPRKSGIIPNLLDCYQAPNADQIQGLTGVEGRPRSKDITGCES